MHFDLIKMQANALIIKTAHEIYNKMKKLWKRTFQEKHHFQQVIKRCKNRDYLRKVHFICIYFEKKKRILLKVKKKK